MTLRRGAFAPLARFWYLALTPAFALFDFVGGIDLRVSLLDAHPRLRVGYYLFDLLCGVAITLRPAAARPIALVESGANIGILFLGVLLAYFAVLDSAGGPGPLVNPFTPEAVANLAISAGWAYLAWVRSAMPAPRESLAE